MCEPCVEIAEGRDIDVLEIDAATHTGVDNVREVIIEGLSIAPVRNRYKVFLIDEVHMLSTSSFNALLKSIEEPPPHVVFMMATTELHKIPDTVLSRSQIYEFKTISSKTVAERLRFVADQEGITVPDDALLLLARAGEGSMRDSLSAFDQVRAFAGDTFTARRRHLGARTGRPRPGVRRARQRWPPRTPPRPSRWSKRPSSAATTCASCAASWPGRRATCCSCRWTRRGSRIPTSPARPSGRGSPRSAARYSREDLLRAFDALHPGRARRASSRTTRASSSRWRWCG